MRLRRTELALRGQEYYPQELIDYEYRKTFGLSFAQFLQEPGEVFAMGVQIMRIKMKVSNEATKRNKRKVKSRS